VTVELDRGLDGLAALEKAHRLPTRLDARPVLLEIGRLLALGETSDLDSAKRRISAFSAPFADAWSAAVRDEIAMAATEHVRSADPRYLAHPKYDWEYAIEARERLGWRMKAVQFLGMPPDPSQMTSIERADRQMEASSARRKPNS
jgi:hypothetical protein